MPKVYVVSRGYHDYSAAEPFGELIYLAEGTVNKFNVSNMLRRFTEKLRFSQKDDYLLVAGPQIMGIIASTVFAGMHGRLNLLIFRHSTEGDEYIARSIVLPNWEEELISD